MASLLLIGGTGFFGKSFLDSFQRGDLKAWGIDKVIAMARNADQLKVIAPQLLQGGVELINADVGSVESLPYAEYVIHAAASTDARNYLSSPLVERNNIQSAVYNYCRLAPRFHQSSKIVYVSSGAVYGMQPADMPLLREDYQCTNLEGLPEHKRDYAFAKREAEKAIKEMSATYGMLVNVARCFAFIGPWLPREQHFAIGNFLNDIANNQTIKVKATDNVYRSYMHADDLVEWLLTIADHTILGYEEFNVGSDEAIEIHQLAKLMGQMYGVDVMDRPTSEIIDRYIPSIEKAKSLLGLRLGKDLKTAIRETLERLG